MQTPCPHCRQTVVQDANSAGHVIVCPRCHQDFQVPSFSVTAPDVPMWVFGLVVFLTIAMTYWWI